MAQVMLLIGLLLLAYLVRRAFLFMAPNGLRRSADMADQSAAMDRPAHDERDLAVLKQQRDDLEERVAVLERLLSAGDPPTALPPPAKGADKASPTD